MLVGGVGWGCADEMRWGGYRELGGYAKNHPVRLRLPPLHRRGMVWRIAFVQIRGNHPVRLRLPPLHRRGMVRHYACADTRQPPRQAAPATPPQEGNVLALYLCRYEATTPSGGACHPSTGGEWSGTILVQIRGNHPVRRSLPPLLWRGMVRHYTCADTRQPPRQAEPARVVFCVPTIFNKPPQTHRFAQFLTIHPVSSIVYRKLFQHSKYSGKLGFLTKT